MEMVVNHQTLILIQRILQVLTMKSGILESLHSNVDIAKRWFGMKKIVGMKLPLTSYRSLVITSPTTETNYKK
jgi:hypothetical protein